MYITYGGYIREGVPDVHFFSIFRTNAYEV